MQLKVRCSPLHHRSIRKLHTVRHISLVLGCYSTYPLGDSARHSMIVTLELMVWFQHLRRVRQGRYLLIALHIPSSSSVTIGMGFLDVLRNGTTLMCFRSSLWALWNFLAWIRNATGMTGDEVNAVEIAVVRHKITNLKSRVIWQQLLGGKWRLYEVVYLLCHSPQSTVQHHIWISCDFCNKSIDATSCTITSAGETT